MPLPQNPADTPSQNPKTIHQIPQHHNALICNILRENLRRTLYGEHPDIIVYEVSGWNIYVVKSDTEEERVLMIDTSNPQQHSEIALYQKRQYMGRTFMKLHKEYDQFAKDFFSGRLPVTFKVPEKIQE